MITNVYQRKDGRYEGRVTTGRIDGKRQYKAFFGKTVDDVKAKMATFREQMMKPIESVSLCKTFSEVFDEWFQTISIRVKESTLANYTLKADKHILPVYGEMAITEIQPSTIYKFIKSKQDSGLSNRYIIDISTGSSPRIISYCGSLS